MAFLWVFNSFSASAQCNLVADFTFVINGCEITMTPAGVYTPAQVLSFAWKATYPNGSVVQVLSSTQGTLIPNSGATLKLNQTGFIMLNHAIVMPNEIGRAHV